MKLRGHKLTEGELLRTYGENKKLKIKKLNDIMIVFYKTMPDTVYCSNMAKILSVIHIHLKPIKNCNEMRNQYFP